MQQNDISVQLDKITARSANFLFEIGSAASIGLINLDIQLSSITFYILPINTSFLLGLADIEKLGAFYNNIIEKIMQI